MRVSQVLSIGLGIICMLVSSMGCTHMHRVVNTGDTMLHDVTVQSGEREFGHGYLPPKAVKGYSGSMDIRRSPPPVVSWKLTEDGEVMRQEVILDAYPAWREVVFELDGKTVKGSLREP